MEKPIQLRIEESKQNIVNFINDECIKNEIDFYFLEYILKEIYQEVTINRDKELESIKSEYNKSKEGSGE
jgi:phage/plasmid-associated DNA primase